MKERDTINTDIADRELTITRVFNSPRELVWKAWTDPDHIIVKRLN